MTDGPPTWLGRRPAERIEMEGLVVRRYVADDATGLARVVTGSFDHLRPHMAWTRFGVPTVEQERDLIAAWDHAWGSCTEFSYGVFDGTELVGSTGYHVRNGEGVLEIGYWVAATRTKRGIATRVARALTDEAFSIDGVREVVVFHDGANVVSGRVPEKLGFKRMGTFARSDHPLFSTIDRAEGDGESMVEWRVTREEWSSR